MEVLKIGLIVIGSIGFSALLVGISLYKIVTTVNQPFLSQ